MQQDIPVIYHLVSENGFHVFRDIAANSVEYQGDSFLKLGHDFRYFRGLGVENCLFFFYCFKFFLELQNLLSFSFFYLEVVTFADCCDKVYPKVLGFDLGDFLFDLLDFFCDIIFLITELINLIIQPLIRILVRLIDIHNIIDIIHFGIGLELCENSFIFLDFLLDFS